MGSAPMNVRNASWSTIWLSDSPAGSTCFICSSWIIIHSSAHRQFITLSFGLIFAVRSACLQYSCSSCVSGIVLIKSKFPIVVRF